MQIARDRRRRSLKSGKKKDPPKEMTCLSCGFNGPPEMFSSSVDSSCGKSKMCKVCRNSYQKQWKEKDRVKGMLKAAKGNAKRDGKEFSITREDLEPLPDVCPILGLKLEFSTEGRKPNSYSIDRIDSNVGYVPGNIQVVSWRANHIKNNATPEELRMIADYLESR
jgi:hypothetical protein